MATRLHVAALALGTILVGVPSIPVTAQVRQSERVEAGYVMLRVGGLKADGDSQRIRAALERLAGRGTVLVRADRDPGTVVLEVRATQQVDGNRLAQECRNMGFLIRALELKNNSQARSSSGDSGSFGAGGPLGGGSFGGTSGGSTSGRSSASGGSSQSGSSSGAAGQSSSGRQQSSMSGGSTSGDAGSTGRNDPRRLSLLVSPIRSDLQAAQIRRDLLRQPGITAADLEPVPGRSGVGRLSLIGRSPLDSAAIVRLLRSGGYTAVPGG